MESKPAEIVWISNRSTTPYVTIDKQNRLYISKPARDLMHLPDGKFRLITAYDKANHRILLGKPEIVQKPDIEPFNFDKRSYSKAKVFVEQANLQSALPLRFIYAGKVFSEYKKGTYAFSREDRIGEDD